MIKWNIKRIKNLLFGFQGTAIHCPKCKSLNVSFGKSEIIGNIESYDVKCNDCKSWGKVKETWYKEHESPSIDEDYVFHTEHHNC